MKIPGPDHPITIEANPLRVRVHAGTISIAASTRALTLRESRYRDVQYIPRADIDMTRLTRTSRITHCPYKGDASHYSIEIDGRTLENAAWSYESPFPAMHQIAGRLAFYPDKVTVATGESD